MLSSYFKRKVLLIDADLRRPHLHRLFNVTETAGSSESLRDPAASVSPVNLSDNLDLLTAGVLRTMPELYCRMLRELHRF